MFKERERKRERAKAILGAQTNFRRIFCGYGSVKMWVRYWRNVKFFLWSVRSSWGLLFRGARLDHWMRRNVLLTWNSGMRSCSTGAWVSATRECLKFFHGSSNNWTVLNRNCVLLSFALWTIFTALKLFINVKQMCTWLCMLILSELTDYLLSFSL